MLANVMIRRVVVLLLSLCTMATALASNNIPEARQLSNEPVRMGHYDVYYSTFNSSFLEPDVASAYQLERNSRTGILNIAIRDVEKSGLGKAVTANIAGETSNLLSQKTGLKFHEVKEGSAIYYLASFRFTNEETLKFTIDVQPEKQSRGERVEFRKKFYEE